MFPSFTMDDFQNRTSIDAIFFAKKSTVVFFAVYCSNMLYFLFCENVRMLTFAFGGLSSTFRKHIPHVFSVTSCKQMLWINTRRIVAMMADAWFLFCNLFSRKQKGNSVCQLLMSKLKRAVSALIFTANPNPTRSRNTIAGDVCLLFNLAPKSLFKC